MEEMAAAGKSRGPRQQMDPEETDKGRTKDGQSGGFWSGERVVGGYGLRKTETRHGLGKHREIEEARETKAASC